MPHFDLVIIPNQNRQNQGLGDRKSSYYNLETAHDAIIERQSKSDLQANKREGKIPFCVGDKVYLVYRKLSAAYWQGKKINAKMDWPIPGDEESPKGV